MRTCDQLNTSGRRFQQEHSCTLPKDHEHTHFCAICGHEWEASDERS